METIYQELKEQKNVRSNLSALRAQLKKDAKAQAYAQAETFAEENKSLFWKVTMQRRERMRHCY